MARNDHLILGKNVHCLRAHKQDGASAQEAGAASDDHQKSETKNSIQLKKPLKKSSAK
jgi:hypothetical protein